MKGGFCHATVQEHSLGLKKGQVLSVEIVDVSIMKVYVNECSFCSAFKNASKRNDIALKTLDWFLSETGYKEGNLFNPFELFHWHPQSYTIVVMSIVVLASLFYYRPFCQFICPAGLITWIFEQVSIFRIQKNDEKCNSCSKCIKESPCDAIESITHNHKIIPDCFACGKCIESSPENALLFYLR